MIRILAVLLSLLVLRGSTQASTGFLLNTNPSLNYYDCTDTPPCPSMWPSYWFFWNAANGGPETGTYLSPSNSWAIWYNTGYYQTTVENFLPGDRIRVGGWLYTPSWDPLRSGSKYGAIKVEFYSGTNGYSNSNVTLLAQSEASPTINSNSANDTWIYSTVTGTVPASGTHVRVSFGCFDYGSGNGRFYADDVFMSNETYSAVLVQNRRMNLTLPGYTFDYWSLWNTNNQALDSAEYHSGPFSRAFWYDAGMWQDITNGFYAGQDLRIGGWLRTPVSDPLSGGTKYGVIELEYYDEVGAYLTNARALPIISSNSTPDVWILSQATSTVPTAAKTARLVIRCNDYDSGSGRFKVDDVFVANKMYPPNVLQNTELTGTGTGPDDWSQWNDGSHDPDTGTYRSGPNSWVFWWDGGIYQDRTSGFAAGDTIRAGAYLYTPEWDALRDGSKCGRLDIEFWGSTSLLTTASSSTISSNSARDAWIYVQASGTVPTNTTTIRTLIRCLNYDSGSGRFLVDDVFLLDETASSVP